MLMHITNPSPPKHHPDEWAQQSSGEPQHPSDHPVLGSSAAAQLQHITVPPWALSSYVAPSQAQLHPLTRLVFGVHLSCRECK